MVDLPAPIMPTSTTERVPSAAVIWAYWDGPPLAGEAFSGMSSLDGRGCGIPRNYTTPTDKDTDK
jgi:hypothetical protein